MLAELPGIVWASDEFPRGDAAAIRNQDFKLRSLRIG